MTDPTDLIARLLDDMASHDCAGDCLRCGLHGEAAVEIQRLRDEVAEWKERYNRKDGEYGRAIEAAYCCVRCGKPTPLAQARKEALEEAAEIAENCERIIIRSEDREWNAACRSVADALRSRAGEIGDLPIVRDPSVPDGMVKIAHGDGRVEMKPFP